MRFFSVVTPVGASITDRTGTDQAVALQASRDRLFSAIRGLTEEQFRFAPLGKDDRAANDNWCIAAHLAHLLRIERVYVDRARAALVEVDPYVASTRVSNDDDPGLAQHLAVPQMVHGLLNTRRDLMALLEACDEADLQRAILHETLGRMTVDEIAVKMSEHEDEHATAISALVKQAPVSARVIIPLAQRS